MESNTLKKQRPVFPPATSAIRSTYSAAVISAPETINYIDQPLRQPQPDEVCVKMEGVGLCASSLPVWEGREWFTYPMSPGEPGHEGWGEVVAIGKDVKSVSIGDRVALLVNNAYAEFCNCPADKAFLIPEKYGDMPFPGEAFGCLMNIFSRVSPQEGQTVVVLGMGFIGQGITRLCHEAGAKVISVSRRNPGPQSNAITALALQKEPHEDLIKAVDDFTGSKGADIVIECTGKQEPLGLAADLIRNNGKLVIAGYHQDGMREVDLQKWNWKGIDVINAHEREPQKYLDGMEAALKAIDEKSLRPDELISHSFAFGELDEAFEFLRTCPEGLTKAIIKF